MLEVKISKHTYFLEKSKTSKGFHEIIDGKLDETTLYKSIVDFRINKETEDYWSK